MVDVLMNTFPEVFPLWLEEVLELSLGLPVLLHWSKFLQTFAWARHDILLSIDNLVEWVYSCLNSHLGKFNTPTGF